MRKIRLRRRTFFKKKSNLLILIIITLLVSLFFLFRFINQKVNPVLFEYATLESRKLASIIINNAVLKNATEETDIDELFIITRDNEGIIKTIDFNSLAINRILTKVTREIQMNLKHIELGQIEKLDIPLTEYNLDKLKKGIIYEIPSGVVFGNSLLNNLGPKIPVRFSLIGDIVSHVNTKVTNYGINNALIEVNLVLELSQLVILPFINKSIKINTSIPITMKLIQGTVPNYYFNGLNQNSPSLTFPIQ